MSYPAACNNLPNYNNLACPDSEISRIRNFAFIRLSALAAIIAAPDTDTVWTTAIAANDCYIVKQVNGSYDGGTEKTIEGFGSMPVKYVNSDHKAAYVDDKYLSNKAFYDALANAQDWVPAWTSETKVFIASSPCFARAKQKQDNSLDSIIVGDVGVQWKQKNSVLVADMPPTAFNI